jgi:hypothetical protein
MKYYYLCFFCTVFTYLCFLFCFSSLILLFIACVETYIYSNSIKIAKIIIINNNTSYLTHHTDGNVQSVTTCKKTQKTSEADSFRNMKVKISYTLKDGHVG